MAHEYAHGAAAFRQGDDTAYMLGRLTFNPLPHVDPWMSVVMPALLWFLSKGSFVFGAARPVPINPRKFRHYRRGDIIVSSAGVITNFAIALGCAVAFVLIGLGAPLLGPALALADTAQRMMMLGIQLNLFLCFFNLIPIPPLDGSRLLYHLLPPAWGAQYRALDRFGFLLVLALVMLAPGLLAVLLTPASFMGLHLITLVRPYAVGDGWNIFQT
ncbi:MAG TPA: site-2 protease family protein [Gemmatimonadales bacterium]|nr:site-2 protease family protein [Gemmatimonadales bacterium]